MKVFLSSTFKDLEQYRSAVIARLRRLDDVVVRCMEDFGARAASPKDFCLREARDCDLFIGVLGHLYGFIPEGDDASITEQEYLAADEAGRDKLLFVAPDTLPVAVKLLRGDSNPEKQEAFRARVLSQHVVELNWSTPEVLTAGVVEAVHNWRQERATDTPPPPRVSGIDLLTYAQRCRRRWETIDLSTLAAPGALDGDIESPKLSQVFIPQACRRSRPAVSLPRDYLEQQGLDPDDEQRLVEELRERWKSQERLPSLDLIAKPEARRLVLLGDPGAGKSSLTRFVLFRLLDPLSRSADSQSEWQAAMDGSWPVLVELRDLLAREAEGRCSDLISYLSYVGETQGFGFDRATLEAQLRERPSLLIVDGLDEIFSLTRRRAMVEEIVGLETRFPLARVLVTSRIAGFDARSFEAAGFAIATLDDLDSDQIRVFTESWFGLAFPSEPDKAARASDDLLEALARRPQLSAIAGNPLILTIMAIIARHKRLARSRAQLYAQALEVLCYAWDHRRGLSLPADSPLADLQPEDTLLMLRRIAWRMQESGEGLRANAIGESELRAILVHFFAQEWRFPPPKARRAATDMVELLQERSWILTTRGPNLYGFVHRTFLEYLCALELTRRFEAQEITIEALRDDHVVPHVDDDSYSEVIRLLCGQLPVRAADQLIVAIVPQPKYTLDRELRLLLAWQSVSELDPRMMGSAVSACKVALRGLYRWLDVRLTRSHQLIGARFAEALNAIEPGSWPPLPPHAAGFSFSDSADRASETVIRAVAKAIWLPDEHHRRWLFDLLESENWVDRRGAVSVLGCGVDLDVFGTLETRIRDDKSDMVRAAAVEAMARSYPDRSETFAFLKTLVDEDNSGGACVAAVRMLATHYADRPDTLVLLLRWASGHRSPSVRQMAVWMLKEFGDQPRVFQLMRKRVELDKSVGVRLMAILVIARSFTAIPMLFRLLRLWSEDGHDHSDDAVRGVAVRALAQTFGSRRGVFNLLQTRAKHDSSSHVRSVAVKSLAEFFPDRRELFGLLWQLAEDEDSKIRSAAIEGIGRNFWERSDTQMLIKRLAHGDSTAEVRKMAVWTWSQSLTSDLSRRILSGDLDGAWPGLDLREAIDKVRVDHIARRVSESASRIRREYEDLVRRDGFPLRLSWLELEPVPVSPVGSGSRKRREQGPKQ